MPTDIAAAVEAVTRYVVPIWEANKAPDTPSLFTTNVGASRPQDNDRFWGRIHVEEGIGQPVFLGGKIGRSFGTIYVQLFQPSGEGREELDRMGHIMRNALRAATSSDLDGISLQNVAYRTVGTDRSAAYYQANVEGTFEYDSPTT